MSEYKDGIQYTIDVVESAMALYQIDEMPARAVLGLLVSSLKMDLKEM